MTGFRSHPEIETHAKVKHIRSVCLVFHMHLRVATAFVYIVYVHCNNRTAEPLHHDEHIVYLCFQKCNSVDV